MNSIRSTHVMFAFVVAFAGCLVSARASADGQHAELRPAASGDDTAQLQAALSRCTNPRRPPCDLRLGTGVFHTDLLLVRGFVGSITGRGQGRTIIQPVLDRPLRRTAPIYGAEPTLEQPYANLMHFTDNSRVAISRITFEIPAAMRVQPYLLPYPTTPAQTANTLYAAVAVDGDARAELQMTQTSFVGADNDASYFGNNLSFAAIFEGKIRLSPTGDMTRRLQHGRVKIYNNRVFRAGNGFMVRTGDDVSTFLGSNLVDVRAYGIFTEDLGASDVTVVRNNISADFSGIALSQTAPPAVPSDYVFAQNSLHVNIEGDAIVGATGPGTGVANDGISMFNDQFGPETIDANVAIWGNVIQIGQNTFEGITLVSATGKGDVRVVGNRLIGQEPMDGGILVDGFRGGVIAANEMSEIHPRLGDVALLPGSREVHVFEPGDTYTDQGTNNRVIGVRIPAPPAPPETMAATASDVTAARTPAAPTAAAPQRRSLLH